MPAPTPQIDQQLTDIAAMEDAFEQPSCEVYQPMVKYPTDGNPPVINFNIPQSTAFVTYGKIIQNIDVKKFKPFTVNIPTYNFYNYVKQLSPQSVVQLFHPNVVAQQPVVANIISNAATRPVASPFLNVRMAAVARPVALPANLAANLNRNVSATNVTAAPAPVAAPAMPMTPIANFAQQAIRGLYTHRFMNGAAVIKYVAQPFNPVPCITVIEEYTTESFLGDYGAGKVVKTFSLLPGEKTTISIRTYEDQESTASAADNILDSFSDSSATELDNLLQQEQGSSDAYSGTNGGNDTSYNTYSDSHNSSSAWNISAKVGIGDFLSVGGGYGRSQSDTSTSSGGFADSTSYSNSAARSSNMSSLASAMDKSVQQSNAARQVQVNHTTTNSSSSGEEDTTVRQIQNVNLSRTLNIVWRQLLQQYTTITWLSGLKFAYTNGYPETYKMVDISALPLMLADIIDVSSNPDNINDVMCQLLKPYCSVMNWQDNTFQFIEAITNTIGGCLSAWLPTCATETETIWRKSKTCTDTYTDGVIDITVNGVILNVQKQTLVTPSLIADALLGAGEALDCFNQKSQDATSMAAYINNLQSMQQLERSIQDQNNDQDIADQKLAAITAITDPVTAATLYKKVYGDCCDVPQNTDCGGCGCA